jgi:opacity protein-like surface antigen
MTKVIWIVIAAALACLMVPGFVASGQNVEVTGHLGGQFNGGLDLSNTRFRRIEVGNGASFGVTAGYLIGDRYGIEFQWNHNKASTVAEPRGGGTNIKIFNLTTNQYMGNFLFHFADREQKLRPFAMLGGGATSLSTDVSLVKGVTRFAFGLGGGAKYNLSPYLGLRVQAKWSPTYIATTNGGMWCDPFWGGCFFVGNSHYLQEFDVSAGITFRF